MAGREWLWIAGNHDPRPVHPRKRRRGMAAVGLTFRTSPKGQDGEISGHHHPKWSATGRMRPCFLLTGRGVILPPSAPTQGGLRADDRLWPRYAVRNAAILTGPKPSGASPARGSGRPCPLTRSHLCPIPRGSGGEPPASPRRKRSGRHPAGSADHAPGRPRSACWASRQAIVIALPPGTA